MRIPVNELRPGDGIEQVFIVRDCSFNSTKAGQPFAKVNLGDATGNIMSIFWDIPPSAVAVLENSKYVVAKGSVGTYQNVPQLKLDSISPASPDTVDIADFLPTTSRDIPAMFKELKTTMALVENAFLVELVRALFTDKELCDGFKRAPAASLMHHAYVGGLLEHTLSMAQMAVRVCEHYPELNRDLLLIGILIHDIGKIREFKYDSFIEYSDSGRLVGHAAIGINIVESKAGGIEGFPEELLDLLRHFILSHHGVPEFGAIRRPMTAEAVAIHYIDNLDAKLAACFKATSEQSGAEGNWTSYQKMFDSYLYTGEVLEGGSTAEVEGEGAESSGGDKASLF